MDNLTHTLIGLVAGEAVSRSTRVDPAGLPAQTRRTTLLAIGMIGGNLPDSDLLWSMSSSGDKLGYLLEHRGYTHTLLGCVALTALLYAATLAWLQLRKQRPGGRDRWLLGLFALFAVLLHLGMDALNSYGVHPFWPWNNHWYYGDVLFIVEPLYWIAAAPLVFLMRSTAARVLLALVLFIASTAILVVHGFDWRWWSIPLLAWLLAMLGRRLQPWPASATSVALMALATLGFAMASSVASRRVEAAGREPAGYQTIDQVLSPSPAQPFCWDVLLLQRRGDEYVARRGQLNLIAAPECRSILAGVGTAPMTPDLQQASHGMRWEGRFTTSLSRLAALADASCATRALMQFARAPFAAETPQGWVLGDLRFDREKGLGMAEVLVAPRGAADCPHHAPWIGPRAELLQR